MNPSPDSPPRRTLLGAGAAWVAGAAAAPTPAGATSAPATLPQGDPGRLERLPEIASRHVPPRPVDVWLPPGFVADGSHGVLLMLDGQMAFDPAATWNRQAWQAHRTVAGLMAEGRIPPTVVVAVWNLPSERFAEYFPQGALDLLPESDRADYVRRECNGRARGDDHLRFLADEVLPAVRARYGTAPGPARTVVMGSSMGGLAALAALCRHPQVFGAAGALSAHWVGRGPSRGLSGVRNAAMPLALLQHLQRALPEPGGHRLWVDRGDDALDSLYAPGLAMFAEVLRDRGYTADQAQLRTVPGTGHNETDWSRRTGEVLAFLVRR